MTKSLIRRAKNSLGQRLKHNIFFLHVPKCGGNSIKDALRASALDLDLRKDDRYVYLNNSAIQNITEQHRSESDEELQLDEDGIYRVPETLLLYHMYKKVQCITGHIPFSKLAYEKFGSKYQYITILREPVERYISEYFYNRQHGTETASMSLEEYVQTERGLVQGTEYVLYIGGRVRQNDHVTRQAIDRALRNLEAFDLIGFVEDLPKFSERFKTLYGPRLRISRENVTVASQDRDNISAQVRSKIENICAPDLEIYHKARQLMASL